MAEHSHLIDLNWYNQVIAQTRQKLLNALQNMLEFSEAEEVVQETYLKLYLEVCAKGTVAHPVAFVYKVSRNLAISRLRKSAVDAGQGVGNDTSYCIDTASGPRNACSQAEQKHLLIQTLNQLPPVCRQVFVMRKLHGKSHEEIARCMNISTKTVENHIARGMKLCLAILSQAREAGVDAPQTRSVG